MDDRDAITVATAVREGQSTAVAETEAALARVAEMDPYYGAFVEVHGDRALRVAKARDAEQAAGLPLGPLHGVPVAIKDLFDLAGTRTGAGSRYRPDHIARHTATCIRRLEQAGAVILGKTHMVEFAFGGWGTNPVLGTPRNPHDDSGHRVPGGSSSGSAVAVAAGMVPLAIGSDTGGSIRVPAALCGIIGHKTSPELVAREGMQFLSPSHDTVGPLCRSVRDAALATDVLAGTDPRNGLAAHIEVPLATATIGVIDDPAMAEVTQEVRERFEAMLVILSDMGFRLEPVHFDMPMEEMSARAGAIMSAESYASLRTIVDRPDSGVAPEIVERVRRGRMMSASDYIDLMGLKRDLVARSKKTLAAFDAVVAPSAPFAAPLVHEVDETRTPLSTFGRFVNMLDLCAVSVPAGMTPSGLPAGIQIVGLRGQDARVLRVGRALEARDGGLVRLPERRVGIEERWTDA